MFSKSKINDPIETDQDAAKPQTAASSGASGLSGGSTPPPVAQSKSPAVSAAATRKTPVSTSNHEGPSVIGSDLKITGNLETPGDVQIEGTIEGDIKANMLTVGNGAVVRGEVIADDVVVNGRVIGKLRGSKVRLSATAKVEGDIVHKTIAIEAGANFEGSVKRSEDPLSSANATSKSRPAEDAPKDKDDGSSAKAGSGSNTAKPK